MGLWNDIKESFRKGNYLIRLIYINIAVFIAIAVMSVIAFLMKNPLLTEKSIHLLAIPASLKLLLVKPWTIITYMFTHKDIWHILFNMLWLYWFGKIFLEYLDQKKLVAVYLLGGICGAILFVLSFNIFPAFTEQLDISVAIGASASVMAVVMAIAVYVPNYSITLFLLGRIKIIYIALGIFVLTSVMDFSVNSGGKLAHMGGALFGYLYIVSMRKGRDPGKWINSIIDSISTIFRPAKKMKVTHKKPVTDYDYNKTKAERQAKINKILEKISRGGYDSLTREEKDFLFRESQNKN
ncbi:MAG: rhomboid family intramembrane serine protease [Bacteroidales bacterium]|nr:rhomboid family intramembrane serine protease [Bacteroidales bacterium]MBN2632861.1 rhomboid family intramembrane serine protease [Bacteroidales bacterium]